MGSSDRPLVSQLARQWFFTACGHRLAPPTDRRGSPRAVVCVSPSLLRFVTAAAAAAATAVAADALCKRAQQQYTGVFIYLFAYLFIYLFIFTGVDSRVRVDVGFKGAAVDAGASVESVRAARQVRTAEAGRGCGELLG